MDPVQSEPKFTASFASEGLKLTGGVKKVLVYLGLAILLLLVYVYVSSPMIVTVTGTGEVSVPATNATVSFTLSANSGSVQTAVSNINAGALLMRKYLTSQGVAETDIAESQPTVVPASLLTSGAGGYQATISMAAKTSHVTEVSTLVSNLYSQGALVVSQPILSVENQDALEQQAFNAALKDAKSQAAKVGNSNWKFIRKIVSISQVSSPTTSTSTTKADVANTNSTAVANGVFKIVKAVSVSYKMW